MVIGRHEPKPAEAASLAQAIAVGLDEAMTALEESFHDLTDEQVWRKALPGRHNIATIVMHAQENLDMYACRFQTGRPVLEHEDRFDIWRHGEQELRDKQENLPTVETMVQRLHRLREAAMPGLQAATNEELLGLRCAEDFWKRHGRTSAGAYMRTIWHTMAHVRQIWLMRGAMGLTDADGWPEQHYA